MSESAPRPSVDHPGLIPGLLLASDDRPAPRTARDWTVDVIFFVLATVFGLVFYFGSVQAATQDVAPAAKLIDLLLGLLACVLLWWRRRYPIPIAIVVMIGSAFSATLSMAAILLVFSTAVHRRTAQALAVGAGFTVTSLCFSVIRPQDTPMLVNILVTLAFVAAFVAWGMFVRARRQLIVSLRERAERAEADQRMQAERARTAERTRIAREMHDVLAHRISLVALHAGALELRPDLSPDEVKKTAQLLRSTARQALEELRDVIGVLRSDDAGASDRPPPPQPTLADVPRLVADSRAAGENVQLAVDVPAESEVPVGVGRDAYRIVQEALTNARKHANGTATRVAISGDPGAGLTVCVRNKLPLTKATAPLPGAGAGLVGLQERVSLAGGVFSYGPDGHDDFVVTAELPWRAG
ncbi:MAG: sensor histidine kinase [Jatrophihabitans sp.]